MKIKNVRIHCDIVCKCKHSWYIVILIDNEGIYFTSCVQCKRQYTITPKRKKNNEFKLKVKRLKGK